MSSLQADSTERVLYKITTTNSKVVLVDDETPHVVIEELMHLNLPIFKPRVHANTITFENLTPSLTRTPQPYNYQCEMKDDRIIIFTSGTTGNPKGVRLSYSAYECNRKSFDQFLIGEDEEEKHTPSLLIAIITNPLHHTNSTAITDWCMRRPHSRIHLLSRYTTPYWRIIVSASVGIPFNDITTQNEQNIKDLLHVAKKSMFLFSSFSFPHTHLLTYSLTYSLTHLLTHLLTYSPTHSPTHPLTFS
jgi:hypothetical protein